MPTFEIAPGTRYNGTGNSFDSGDSGYQPSDVITIERENDSLIYRNSTDLFENSVFASASAGGYRLDFADNTGGVTVSGGDFRDWIFGGTGVDNLRGFAGDDVIDGGVGADRMEGGDGNDNYFVDNNGDLVIEVAGQGTDRVYSSINYNLGDNVELLVLTGTGNINGTGNSLDNQIQGNSSNNRLDGGLGADRLTGGNGNDTYIVDNTGDVTIELGDQGVDTVVSSVSHTLRVNVENLTLFGDVSVNGRGNGANNEIIGNGVINRLDGFDGNDTLRGGGGNDSLYGGAGSDLLEGGVGADTLFGGAGSDTFFYQFTSDSVVGSRDVIRDFQRGQDFIQIFADADVTLEGAQDFQLIDTPDFTAAGQLRTVVTRSGLLVEGNTDADLTTVDFQVLLVGVTEQLARSDFRFFGDTA